MSSDTSVLLQSPPAGPPQRPWYLRCQWSHARGARAPD